MVEIIRASKRSKKTESIFLKPVKCSEMETNYGDIDEVFEFTWALLIQKRRHVVLGLWCYSFSWFLAFKRNSSVRKGAD